jgi:hypothetical protein
MYEYHDETDSPTCEVPTVIGGPEDRDSGIDQTVLCVCLNSLNS